MILAAFRDTGYEIVLLLHIIAVIVAIAPAVVHPIMFTLEQKRPDGDVQALATRVTGLPTRIYSASLVLSGILGIGLVSMSDDVIKWGDTWVWLSLLLWVVLNGVLHGVMLPAEKDIAAGDTAAIGKAENVGRILVLLVLVLLYLMVLKPGGSGF